MVDRSIIGSEPLTFTFPIEKGKIREFARAAYDDNPVYEDEEYARNEGLGGIIPPPTFAESARFYSGEWSDLKPERMGTGLDAAREFEYLGPVHPGDILTGVHNVVDVYEKYGQRGGKMTFTVRETVYTNQKGEKVLVVRKTGVRMSKPVSRQLGSKE